MSHPKIESNAAALLADLPKKDRRRFAGVLLTFAASLLEESDDAPPVEASEWLTLDDARKRLGLAESRGTDRNRTAKDRLRELVVETSKVGRSILVRRTSLEAAIAARAKTPRARGGHTPSPESDSVSAAASAVTRSGWDLRSVAGGRK